jgi:hypothetical protein
MTEHEQEINADDKLEVAKKPRGRPKKPPPPPKPPKEAKPPLWKGREKEYFREYYKEKCSPCSCSHCSTAFTCERSLARHLVRNKNCRLKRLTEEIQSLMERARQSEAVAYESENLHHKAENLENCSSVS